MLTKEKHNVLRKNIMKEKSTETKQKEHCSNVNLRKNKYEARLGARAQ